MSNIEDRPPTKARDSIQDGLVRFACGLNFDALTPQVTHAAKIRIIDTLGGLIAGFFGEPCRIARGVAAQIPVAAGATVIGTRMKTTPDMAAFVNATTARYAEMNDTYHWPDSYHGHVSDIVMPVLAAAEYAQCSGREFITGVVLAYEVFCRICDVFRDRSFDNTIFACISSAAAAGKLMGLSSQQLAHCISMAAVPNNVLRQVRLDQLSMFKGVASGQAGRAGVFAALLARAGMEGPHLPFEGKAGWCEHVARERFSLDALGSNGALFKILVTYIKIRPVAAGAISAVVAAEKIAPLSLVSDVRRIKVEVNKYAKDGMGSGERHWNPQSREDADHSLPYVVAATLLEGTLTLRSFGEARLRSEELRALMQKIELVENPEFTRAFQQLPVQHRARVTVITSSGERVIGEAGSDKDDLATPKSDAQIEGKFRGITEDVLETQRVNAILERLWHLEEMDNVACIPAQFVIN